MHDGMWCIQCYLVQSTNKCTQNFCRHLVLHDHGCEGLCSLVVFTSTTSKSAVVFTRRSCQPCSILHMFGRTTHSLWITFYSQMRLNFTMMLSPIQEIFTLGYTKLRTQIFSIHVVWNIGQLSWSACHWQCSTAASYRHFLENELQLCLEIVPFQVRW